MRKQQDSEVNVQQCKALAEHSHGASSKECPPQEVWQLRSISHTHQHEELGMDMWTGDGYEDAGIVQPATFASGCITLKRTQKGTYQQWRAQAEHIGRRSSGACQTAPAQGSGTPAAPAPPAHQHAVITTVLASHDNKAERGDETSVSCIGCTENWGVR